MKDPEISGILNIKRNRDNSGSELRIKDDKQILQSAMDYCGNWYTGFKMPSDALCINRQKINEMGGFEKVAELVATEYLIEKNSTHKGNDTLN